MMYSQLSYRRARNGNQSRRNSHVFTHTGHGTEMKDVAKALAFLILAWALYWLIASLPYVFGH